MTTPTWSATRLKAWHRCARLHHYRYGLGLGEPPTDVTAFGSVGHAHLEVDLVEAMGLNVGRAPDPLPDAYEQARLDALLAGYRLRWESTPWNVLGVEVPFEFELGGHVITGRMDALVQDARDGSRLVVEHKFTASDASPGSVYWEKLTLDLQASIYFDAAGLVLGAPVDGVVYDVLAKPRHEPKRATLESERTYTKPTQGKGCKACGGSHGGKRGVEPGTGCESCNGTGWHTAPKPSRLHAGQRATDETPDEFFARIAEDIAARPDDFYSRVKIVRTEDELPKMRADILDTIKLARVAEIFGVHPRNSSACHQFGSRCHFWDACSGAADIDDPIRFPRRAHVEPLAQITP